MALKEITFADHSHEKAQAKAIAYIQKNPGKFVKMEVKTVYTIFTDETETETKPATSAAPSKTKKQSGDKSLKDQDEEIVDEEVEEKAEPAKIVPLTAGENRKVRGLTPRNH